MDRPWHGIAPYGVDTLLPRMRRGAGTARKRIRTVARWPAEEGEGPDAAWLALHAEREEVERALALCQARRRFAKSPAEAGDAQREEAELLVNLDRVLTRIRAAEYGRQPGARRW